MIPIEYIILPLAVLNTIAIAILVAKRKFAIAFGLAFIQALIIGGLSFI